MFILDTLLADPVRTLLLMGVLCVGAGVVMVLWAGWLRRKAVSALTPIHLCGPYITQYNTYANAFPLGSVLADVEGYGLKELVFYREGTSRRFQAVVHINGHILMIGEVFLPRFPGDEVRFSGPQWQRMALKSAFDRLPIDLISAQG
jgi:hypothetical protein